MNRNILLVLGGGFLLAILLAVMVSTMMKGDKKPEEVAVQKTEILVAAKNLTVGEELEKGDLRWQEWPEGSAFVGAIIRDGEQTPEEAMSGKLLRSLSEGQPVHMSLVVEEDQGDFLSANIQKGKRAVGLEVKKEVVADRLIKPGDFVDVIVTYQVRINTRNNPDAQAIVNRYASETVIRNIRILAIDNNDTKAMDEIEKGQKTKKKSGRKVVVTLEVSPEEAEKLLLADRMGDVGLALRPLGSTAENGKESATTDVGMSQVMTHLTNLNTTSSAVRIYNGNQMQEVRGRRIEIDETIDFDVEENRDDSVIVIDRAALPTGEEE